MMSTLTEKTHDESTRVTDQLLVRILSNLRDKNGNYLHLKFLGYYDSRIHNQIQ